MQIKIEIVGHIDADLGIKEKNHTVMVELQDQTWKGFDWKQRALFLDELTDIFRHWLTKYGQADYTIIANQKEGLDYDDSNN